MKKRKATRSTPRRSKKGAIKDLDARSSPRGGRRSALEPTSIEYPNLTLAVPVPSKK